MIIEKDIARVSIGSYVVEIVKQRGSHNIKQKGWIRNLRTIEKLIDLGVERVSIDTSKQLSDEPEEVTPIEDVSTKEEAVEGKPSVSLEESKIDTPVSPAPIIPKKSASVTSIAQAKTLFDDAKNIQRKILDDVVCGRQLELEPIQEITEHTTEAIFENPDALACIINIRKKDEYLLEHSTAVSILMSVFARHMNLDIKIAKELAVGAFLHDVGKIMIPDSILNKPGKLTVEEFEVMKTHVNHSIEIIENTSGISSLSLEVAALHHEKLDGGGYPNSLPSEKISQYGRMITICDIFDALTANRVYKDGMAQVKAFAILLNMAEQKMLDVSLVNRFIKCMGVYPVGSLVQLNSNQLAVVESRNAEDPIRPKVKAFYSVNQEHFLQAKHIDLAETNIDHIEKGVRADDFNLDMNKILEFLLLEG